MNILCNFSIIFLLFLQIVDATGERPSSLRSQYCSKDDTTYKQCTIGGKNSTAGYMIHRIDPQGPCKSMCMNARRPFIPDGGSQPWICGDCECSETGDCISLEGYAGKWMNFRCNENKCVSNPDLARFVDDGWECGKCNSTTCIETDFSICHVDEENMMMAFGKWLNDDCSRNKCVGDDLEPYLASGWECGKCGIPFCMETPDCTTETGEVGKWINYQCNGENKCVSDPEMYLNEGWECDMCLDSMDLPACPNDRCTTVNDENGVMLYRRNWDASNEEECCDFQCVLDAEVEQYFNDYWFCGSTCSAYRNAEGLCDGIVHDTYCSIIYSCIAPGGADGKWISYNLANGQCVYVCSPTPEYYTRRGWVCGQLC